jgi:hypothetical protein
MDATTRHAAAELQRAVVDVWFDRAVWNAGSRVGTVTGVVCTPFAPHLHDVVVRAAESPHDEHLVARAHLAPGDDRDLVVHPQAIDIRARPIPTRTVLVTDYGATWWDPSLEGQPGWSADGGPLQIPVTEPVLAPGEILLHHHAAVYAGDHHAGRLAGLRAATADGAVNGLIVDVGHRWHHRWVLVPRDSIAELAETVAWVLASRDQLRRMEAPAPPQQSPSAAQRPSRSPGADDRDPGGAADHGRAGSD